MSFYLVAIGAAIMAASLEKRDDLVPLMLRNVTPLSIGLLCKGRIVRKVVKRNTVYPNEINCKGKTVIDNQDNLFLDIYEGEYEHPAFNKKLGSMKLEGIQIASAGILFRFCEFVKNNTNNYIHKISAS